MAKIWAPCSMPLVLVDRDNTKVQNLQNGRLDRAGVSGSLEKAAQYLALTRRPSNPCLAPHRVLGSGGETYELYIWTLPYPYLLEVRLGLTSEAGCGFDVQITTTTGGLVVDESASVGEGVANLQQLSWLVEGGDGTAPIGIEQVDVYLERTDTFGEITSVEFIAVAQMPLTPDFWDDGYVEVTT